MPTVSVDPLFCVHRQRSKDQWQGIQLCLCKSVLCSVVGYNRYNTREQKISFRVIQSTQDSWYLNRWLLEDHSCRGRRPWDPKLSPAVPHGFMLGFTLDWGFKPHSGEDCGGGIMVVFWGGNDVGRKGINLKQIVR